jgi:predicted hydrocarbon binding protein
MAERFDFERYWLSKLAASLVEHAGQTVCQQIMTGSDALSDQSDRQQVIVWSQQAIDRLEALVDGPTCQQVMLSCACQHGKADLRQVKEYYQTTADLDGAHRMLQDQFESFLRQGLKVDEAIIAEVVARGWGLAGIRQGSTIVATKIPKSGYLVQYMQSADPEQRRQYYCHCPRVRDALKTHVDISPTYCYCGGGFYQGIWEEILGEPVQVELLSSVLAGDDTCSFVIRLPIDP